MSHTVLIQPQGGVSASDVMHSYSLLVIGLLTKIASLTQITDIWTFAGYSLLQMCILGYCVYAYRETNQQNFLLAFALFAALYLFF